MLVIVLLWDNNRIIYIIYISSETYSAQQGKNSREEGFLGGILLEKTGLGIFWGRQVSLKVRYLMQQ